MTHKFLYGVKVSNPASGVHALTVGSTTFFPKTTTGAATTGVVAAFVAGVVSFVAGVVAFVAGVDAFVPGVYFFLLSLEISFIVFLIF